MLARLGRFEEAIEAYRAALAVDPTKTAVRLNLGIALYKAARYADAVPELAAVLTAQPDNLQARYLEADCHLRHGRAEARDRAAGADRSRAIRTISRSPTCSASPICRRTSRSRGSGWSIGS